MRHFVKYDLIPLLSMVVVCAFPCVILFSRNAAEADAVDMLPFMGVFLVNAVLFFLLTLIFFRNASRSAFWTDLAMLVVINFCLVSGYVKELLPVFRDRFQLILAGVLLLALFVLLLRKKPDMRTGCLLLVIGFGTVIIINAALAVPALIGRRNAHARFDESPASAEQDLSQVVFRNPDRPNVYWFLFDEYGGYENLMHYYDYDNSEFLGELEDRGFTVSNTSRNTEGIFSVTLLPNLLNMNYMVAEEDPTEKKRIYMNNCQMYRMFANNGYEINMINHVDALGHDGLRVLTTNQAHRTISEYLLRNSIYSKMPTVQAYLKYFFVSDYGANYRVGLDRAMETGLTCWREAEKNDAPTLTIGYYQFPHSPTMVGPNGEQLPYASGWNWRDKDLYLGQVIYCSKYILNLVDEIQAHDPGALIFLESDHGNRYAMHMLQVHTLKEYDPYVENPYMQNILNCVYYQGQTFDIEGQTGINTMRRVFNQVFDADLTEIEPVYSYLYAYEDEQW